MTAENERPSSLLIEVDAELRRIDATDDEWGRLSASAFARDWDSDTDVVSGDLAHAIATSLTPKTLGAYPATAPAARRPSTPVIDATTKKSGKHGKLS